ncbi:MAG: hypothetical protein Ct9H300mP1_28040 [Planctomycetaceae bacterium]|nr:MAG: hypothetical protein Ct9H300mP1_28040 [Planctomycetaceae bacterium]
MKRRDFLATAGAATAALGGCRGLRLLRQTTPQKPRQSSRRPLRMRTSLRSSSTSAPSEAPPPPRCFNSSNGMGSTTSAVPCQPTVPQAGPLDGGKTRKDRETCDPTASRSTWSPCRSCPPATSIAKNAAPSCGARAREGSDIDDIHKMPEAWPRRHPGVEIQHEPVGVLRPKGPRPGGPATAPGN